MISDQTRDKWKRKLNTILKYYESNSIQLNDWELEFVDSIEKRLSEGKDLTFNQSKSLNKIYNKC